MSKLAIFGGPKVRTELFPSQNTYDEKEMEAVTRVMKRGRLSGYRGNWTKDFYGGPEVQALESEWSQKWNVVSSIFCNSATSGLFIALKALEIGPGDKVIVTPYSMTCSASLPLALGAKPIFADVEREQFCISYESVKNIIEKNPDVKAILAVSIFGQPFDPRLKEFGIPIIEDAAQALGSKYIAGYDDADGEQIVYGGTLGDIGVYSFNYGKHLTAGEGGMVVTQNPDLGLKCRLLMNHADSVVNDMVDLKVKCDIPNLRQMVGFNLRGTELSAAIIREQLKKFDKLLERRLSNVKYIQNQLNQIPAIRVPQDRTDCVHSHYVLPFLWDSETADGLHRNKFIEAVKAELTPRKERDTEGVQIGYGYIKPIYRMPIFDLDLILPIVEKLWQDDLFLTLLHAPNSDIEDCVDVAGAFFKVWALRKELQ